MTKALQIAGSLILLGLSLAALPNLVAAVSRDPLEALVEVRVLAREPDPLYPWRRDSTAEQWGSGAILEGRRILTAAHVIQDQVSVEIRRRGTSRWFGAEVRFVCDQADLALLDVTSAEFWQSARGLRLGRMPHLRDSVQVLGFPVGGTGAAITRGIVSRIHVGRYTHSRANLLLAQIDAAINSGASGGPVIAAGELVGIALQSMNPSDGEAIGNIAPIPVIEHFLRDAEDGRIDGFPRSGIWWQQVSSQAHRASLGIPDDGLGVRVIHVDDGSAAQGRVQAGDILRSIEGLPISADGSIESPLIGRTEIEFLVQMKDAGSPVSLEVLRAGAPLKIELHATYYEPMIPARHFARSDPYLIFGGLVLQPLTYRYFSLFEDNDPPANLEVESIAPYRTRERQQIIVISSLLPTQATSSYRWAEDRIVRAVNDVGVRNLTHLAELLDSATGRFVRIELDAHAELVFDLAEARSQLPALLAEHDAKRDRAGLTHSGPLSLPASPRDD